MTTETAIPPLTCVDVAAASRPVTRDQGSTDPLRLSRCLTDNERAAPADAETARLRGLPMQAEASRASGQNRSRRTGVTP